MTTTLEAPPTGRTDNKLTDVRTQKVFTTGEAAEICNVSQQTIIRNFDSGELRGFRVPGSRFRRIPREELIRFMKKNNMSLNNILSMETDGADLFGKRPWQHESRNGTVFTTQCRDFSTEIHAEIPRSLAESKFAEDVAEMIDRHLTTIHPLLKNFTGYGTLVYTTVRV